jgi:hypothetical protein
VQSYQSLPDLTGYRSKAAKRIFKLAEEHAEKTTELGRLGSDVEEAKRGLQDARNKDTEARALAARRGDKDPGRVHEEKARAHLEDLQDKYGVLERVVADVEADLSRVITESKIELIEEARTKRDEHNRRFTEAKRHMRVEGRCVLSDRLGQLLSELEDELESRREEDRLRLAEWFEGVLNTEYSKRAVQANLVEQLRQAHGLGDEEEREKE